MLDEVLSVLGGMRPDEKPVLAREVVDKTRGMLFMPNAGPQTDAYLCQADVLLFGGSPGGGKTALEIGLAINEHYRSLIVRRNFSDLRSLIDTAKKLVGSDENFIGGTRPEYRKHDGGVLHFMGLPQDGGVGGLQGEEHDLICVDEAAQVTEAQVRLILGWKRSTRPGQRTRVVLGSNPPLDSTGDWLIEYFAPWLDERHPNPAKPGELRYFLEGRGPNGTDIECAPDAFYYDERGTRVGPQSRTYIPSNYTDNPYYNAEEYARTLAGLPDSVRERLRTGNFMLARNDDLWQVIPTEWVRQAQDRWTEHAPQGIPMSAIGVDVAQGGSDFTVLAPRHDGYFCSLVRVPGVKTPTPSSVAGLVITARRDGALVIIDMGGGYGGGVLERLGENIGTHNVKAYKGAEGSVKRTHDKKLGFRNMRSQTYWLFREALDPDQAGGSPIALPKDPRLLADLCTPLYKIGPHGIEITNKDDVTKLLGRSPDDGDAVVISWSGGKTFSAVQSSQDWRPDQRLGYAGGGRSSGSALRVNYGPRRQR